MDGLTDRPDRRGEKVNIVSGSILDRIDQAEPTYKAMSEEELGQTTTRLEKLMACWRGDADDAPDAFAAVRESAPAISG